MCTSRESTGRSFEDGTSSGHKNKIIGFCDGFFKPKQVLEVIKSSVKVNLCHVDKVVIYNG